MNAMDTNRASHHIITLDSTAMATRSVTCLRNPEGRVGIAGKGLLPQFGANTACIVIVERSGFSNADEVLLHRGVRAQAQFPWFLCRHGLDCSQNSCYTELVREFCHKLVMVSGKSEMIDSTLLKQFINSYSKHVYLGPVSDPINCDNAWLEVTVVYFKIISPFNSINNIKEVCFVPHPDMLRLNSFMMVCRCNWYQPLVL
ncbi:unnamed protein product [Hydatigera taeniaeformis]|uniref:Peptidase S1 domain-containing protein n=1 Tax=Hydatigena taeniaeformis TaxID=6205 RepID=A0A0R3WXS8_HYDTA|nr:unnamed protein product [Hydatigera taeniaeformis]